MIPKGRGADPSPTGSRDGAADGEQPAADAAHGEGPGIERFRVRTRADVVSVLRGLLQQNALVTAYFGPGADFFVTALLAVDAEKGILVFDHGADARQNERLPRAPAARLETYAEHIRVEFSVGSITTVDFEGKPAFAAPLPPSLLRFQRRETYRVHVPRSRPIVCELPPTGDGGQPVLANVRDISIGGIALVDFPPGFRLVQGTVFERCVLTLTPDREDRRRARTRPRLPRAARRTRTGPAGGLPLPAPRRRGRSADPAPDQPARSRAARPRLTRATRAATGASRR